MALRRGRSLALAYNMGRLGHDLRYSIPRFHTEWVCTLLERRSFERFVLVAMPYASRRDKPHFEDCLSVQQILRRKPASVTVELTDCTAWATNPGQRPTVLHEGGWQDMVRPFRLRSFFRDNRFPITVSHHGLPPGGTLRTFGLDLLQCDSRPYDAIVCTSHASRSIIERVIEHTRESLAVRHNIAPLFAGRLEVIPLGVDPTAFHPRPKVQAREKFGLPTNAVVLLWFGRFSFTEKTNLLPLLGVYRDLVEVYPDVPLHFVFAGARGKRVDEDVFQRHAEALGIGSRCHRVTDVAREDNPDLHATADVFVCPSDGIFENFGLAPVQAMATGVPQIVSDWDGHRDTVVHGKTGFLIPTYWGDGHALLSRRASVLVDSDVFASMTETTAVDVRALRESLVALVQNEALRKTMGAHSRARAEALFSLNRVASMYEELWDELHKQARADRRDSARKPLPLPSLHDVYRAQVSHSLGDAAMFQLSNAGARVLAGTESVPLAQLEPSVIEPPVAWQILGLLADRQHTAGDLVRHVGSMCKRSREMVWCQLMWLLKYGYIECTSAADLH